MRFWSGGWNRFIRTVQIQTKNCPVCEKPTSRTLPVSDEILFGHVAFLRLETRAASTSRMPVNKIPFKTEVSPKLVFRRKDNFSSVSGQYSPSQGIPFFYARPPSQRVWYTPPHHRCDGWLSLVLGFRAGFLSVPSWSRIFPNSSPNNLYSTSNSSLISWLLDDVRVRKMAERF